MNNKKLGTLLMGLTLSLLLSSCITRQVQRVSPDQQIDISGRWNSTDSKITAESMINQILMQSWLEDFQKGNNRKPVLVVGLVSNKSHEHIESDIFISDLEKTFIGTGKVRLVQAGDKREELRSERAGQQDYASKETIKKWGQELGADFILQGSVNSIVDGFNKEKVLFYKVTLQLTNVETNEVVWMGDKEIKKYIRN
ncbi:MAG: penicillin-binding protein activator LpoB [Bacteroidetes bacterium]|nr:penicillin-binding protein activator LpoB [Bacteroidota bacterium]